MDGRLALTDCDESPDLTIWMKLYNHQVFINIHEYANEIIFIYDHWMKVLMKLYH